MRTTFNLLIVTVVSVLLVFHSGCRDKKEELVRVGAILPLTGTGAEFGKDGLIGAEMSITDINAKSTVRFKLLAEDSRTQPKDGVSAYQKLMASSNRPVAMICTMSSISSALVPLVERDQLPMFCIAAAPALTKGNKYVFRALPAADYQARTLLELSKSKLDYKSVCILFFTDEFGTSMEASFKDRAGGSGVKVLRSEGVAPDASDFRASLTKLIAERPDSIYIAAFGSGFGSAIRQLRELDFKGTILAPLEMGYQKVLDVAGPAAEGAVFVDTRFDPSASDPATQAFVKEFESRAGREPTLDAVLAYDELQMFYLAGSAKGFTSEGIRLGLTGMQDYQSVNGRAKILPNGDVAYELVLKIIKDGKPVRYQ
jgi:branched-chain amino acid transport system substrate-binding protein